MIKREITVPGEYQYDRSSMVSRVTSDTGDFATVVTLTLNLLSQFLLFFLMAVVLVVRSVQEVMSGITVAKNFRQEQHMYDEFKQVNEQFYQVNVRSGSVYNGVFPVLVLVANIGTVIVVYFGGLNVLDRAITAGTGSSSCRASGCSGSLDWEMRDR